MVLRGRSRGRKGRREGKRQRGREGGKQERNGKKERKMPSLDLQCLILGPQPNHRLEQARRCLHHPGSIRGLKYVNIYQNNYSCNHNLRRPVCSSQLHTP